MRLSKAKRDELKALAEKDRAKTLDYLAWEGFGLASRQAIPDALADIEELEAALTDYIHSTGIGSTLLPDVVPPERAMLNGCGPDATTVLTLPHSQTPEGVIEALESKLADAVKALEAAFKFFQYNVEKFAVTPNDACVGLRDITQSTLAKLRAQ